MAVVGKKRKNGIVYFAVNALGGRLRWERVGTDKREAVRRDARMKKDIAEGTYGAPVTTGSSVGAYLNGFFARRTNRGAADEEARFRNHIEKRCAWFLKLRMDDVRSAHALKLIEDLRKPYTSIQNHNKGQTVRLTEKGIFNVLAPVKTAFAEAALTDLILRNPFSLPRGKGLKRIRTTVRRLPYTVEEVRTLTTDERLDPDVRMWNALAFFTGMREGEVCGRRFRDWDRDPAPLTSLRCDSQYDGQPLKTEKEQGEAPRDIPVHPDLALMLEQWWAEGFELVFLRKPKPNDFIVPCRARDLSNHTKSSAYKLFVRACEAVEVKDHTLHSTRHTFITFCRRAHADAAILERVTHNGAGKVIDVYTHYDWDPLCEAVLCFSLDRPDPAPRHLRAVPHPAKNVRPSKPVVRTDTA